MKTIERLKRWARGLKVELYTLYLAYKDPRVPLHAKLFTAAVVGYAFSPIDLIPDPIPILGYLDDLLLVPLGIMIAVRMIPPHVLAEHRERSRTLADKPVNRVATIAVVAVWATLATLAIFLIARS